MKKYNYLAESSRSLSIDGRCEPCVPRRLSVLRKEKHFDENNALKISEYCV